MIRHTFSFLPGIGEVTEQRLWHCGVRTWHDFLAAEQLPAWSTAKKAACDAILRRAADALHAGDHTFFLEHVPVREHWRLWPAFRSCAVALDIETDGLPARAGGQVTLVGLFDGRDFQALVRGRTLSLPALTACLPPGRFLVTFFGAGFDLPFLQRALGFHWGGLHLDLCAAGKRAGLRGGLKAIERELGIARQVDVQGLDGFEAVRLWHEARRGSTRALELLLDYNRCDTVNLFALADIVYDRLRRRSGAAVLPAKG